MIWQQVALSLHLALLMLYPFCASLQILEPHLCLQHLMQPLSLTLLLLAEFPLMLPQLSPLCPEIRVVALHPYLLLEQLA